MNSEANKQIRPFYWSVRRELWENRSLYLAPLIVAGVIIIGFMFSAVGLAERRQGVVRKISAKMIRPDASTVWPIASRSNSG